MTPAAAAAPTTRVGLDALDRVFVMENHDEAYRVWRDAGVRRRALLHVDAHHDMWWIQDGRSTTIGNFISAALKDGLVTEVVWVVPDRTWDTARCRTPLRRHLGRIIEEYPGGPRPIEVGDRRMSTVVLGKPLTVCSLDSVPPMAEEVLLDIDVDFLVIPRVSYGTGDVHGPLPWCWPDELVARLRRAHIRSDLVTIAHSVEGGYTPLKWKYLGDELAVRLRQPDRSAPIILGMELMRAAALAAHGGDLASAEAKYRDAGNLLPAAAAPYHHLARLYVETGRIEDARRLYRRALHLDASYRTVRNSAGILSQSMRVQAVEGELLRMLTLDSADAVALLGLGQIAAARGRWAESEARLRESLAVDADLVDAYRTLGHVLAKQRRREEAIVAYERSLKLALSGRKSLTAPIATDAGWLSDPDHARIHARLARLYELQGATVAAINGYRISVIGGWDGALLRARLARLYLMRGLWRRSAFEAWQAIIMAPFALRRAARQLARWVHRALAHPSRLNPSLD